MKQKTHIFAVCAYGESPYLDECVRSLLAQTVKSEIILVTSTPNDHIRKCADRYGLRVLVNPEFWSTAVRAGSPRTGIMPIPIPMPGMSPSHTRMIFMSLIFWKMPSEGWRNRGSR